MMVILILLYSLVRWGEAVKGKALVTMRMDVPA